MISFLNGARGLSRPLLIVLVFAFVSLGSMPLCAQGGSSPHTAADFDAARNDTETALDAARKALRRNASLRATADDAAARLTTVSQSREGGAVALKTLSDTDALLKPLIPPATTPAITDALSQAADSLNDPKSKLSDSKAKLDALKNSDDFRNQDGDLQNRVSQTLLDCQTVLDQVGKDGGLNSESNTKLKAAFAKVLAQAVAVTQSLSDALNALAALDDVDPSKVDDPKKAAILKTTGKYLPVFADMVTLKKSYADQWNAVANDLKALDSSIDGSKISLDVLNSSISTIAKRLPNWLAVVKKMPADETGKVESLITAVDLDAPANTASATVELATATSLRDSFNGVEGAWAKLRPIVDDLGADAGNLSSETVAVSLAEFTKNSHALFGAISRLQEAIAGDFSEFEADQQQLYYFTDVPRLMHMLNPGTYQVGGLEGAQEQAAALRKKLAQAEMDLAAAQADVNTYQTRLMQLPEELKQARSDARQQDQAYGKTANRFSLMNGKLGSAGDVLTQANNDAKANPNDRSKQLAAQHAQQDKDRLTAQTTDAQRDNANAQHDKDVADQKLKALEDDQTGIPAQIERAKQALSAAQSNVSQRRQESLLAAQAESDAFALARDNTPYWFAPANGVSKDPARRVEMYGTNDSKIISLRGKRTDLTEVKNIMALIDQPAPQARVTLWSLQLNYTNDTKGNSAKRVNEALSQVEQHLANIRSRMAISVSLLRDSVNDELNNNVGDKCNTLTTADACRVERIKDFYDRQVLLELAIDDKNPDSRISRFTVPDPAGTTTLGEALMVLSLAQPNIRKKVFDEFEKRINAK
jgi:hypothetical protein